MFFTPVKGGLSGIPKGSPILAPIRTVQQDCTFATGPPFSHFPPILSAPKRPTAKVRARKIAQLGDSSPRKASFAPPHIAFQAS